jgi:hypothetical protein
MAFRESDRSARDAMEPLAGVVVAALALVAGLARFLSYHSHGLTVAHYDAKSHLVVTRRIVDSVDPGYLQLGVHWLPLIHLLYLPFALIESQYRSGVGPALVSVAAFVASAWLVFRIARRLVGSTIAAAGAAALVLANPNLGYVQSCPLTEPVYLALMLGSMDALIAWRDTARAGLPWRGAVLGALAAMCRYEGWYFVAGAVALLVWDAVREPARRRSRLAAAALMGGAAGALILAHFGYMYTRVGDTFLQRVARGSYAPFETFHRPFLSTAYHLGELAQAAGVIPLLIGLAGLSYAILQSRPFARAAPLLLLWLPSVTNISVLFWGMIYRVRWSVLLVPAVAVSAAFLFAAPRAARRMLLAAAFAAMALPWVSWMAPQTWEFHLLRAGPGTVLLPVAALAAVLAVECGVAAAPALAALMVLASLCPVLEGEHRAVLAETLEHSYLEPERSAVLDVLRRSYDGRRILVDMGKLAPLVYDSGLSTSEFVHNEADPGRWRRALERPADEVGWLAALRDDEVWRALVVDPHRRDGYSLAVQTEHFVLYRLATGVPEVKRPE